MEAMDQNISDCWYPLLASAGQCNCCFKLRDCPYLCAAQACIEIAQDRVNDCLKNLKHAQTNLAECEEELQERHRWEKGRVKNEVQQDNTHSI